MAMARFAVFSVYAVSVAKAAKDMPMVRAAWLETRHVAKPRRLRPSPHRRIYGQTYSFVGQRQPDASAFLAIRRIRRTNPSSHAVKFPFLESAEARLVCRQT